MQNALHSFRLRAASRILAVVCGIAINVPAEMFMAAGTGKQRLYVIPSLDLVIVRFGHGVGGSFSDHTLLGEIIGVP